MSTSSAVYIGLDVGGSKTELLACTANGTAERLRLSGPGANMQRLGVETTAGILADLIHQALDQYPDGQLATVCAGIAGAGRTDDQAALSERLRDVLDVPQPAPPRIHIVHDAQVALEAAFEEGSGVVVIVGTGSVVFARTRDGAFERTGGWGYLLGDEGSGFALGQSGLRAVAHAIDGGPETLLRSWVAEHHGLDSRDRLIHEVYQHNWPVQDIAPLVIRAATAGDAVAQQIIDAQTRQFARQVEWLIARCDNLEPRMALMGGLMQEAYYAHTLRQTLHERLADWSIQTMRRRPVVGALRLACRSGRADEPENGRAGERGSAR